MIAVRNYTLDGKACADELRSHPWLGYVLELSTTAYNDLPASQRRRKLSPHATQEWLQDCSEQILILG